MDLIEQLKRDEGVRLMPYRDSAGLLTIGVGRCLDRVGISEAEAEVMLHADITRVCAQLAPYSWYQQLDAVRQAAVENLCFNVGLAGLLHFAHMIAAFSAQNWEAAAQEMLTSVWAQQVGARAQRLAQQMRSGEWV